VPPAFQHSHSPAAPTTTFACPDALSHALESLTLITLQSAATARSVLEGHAMYEGGANVLRISVSLHRDLNVANSGDKSRDYTLPVGQPSAGFAAHAPAAAGGGYGGGYGGGHDAYGAGTNFSAMEDAHVTGASCACAITSPLLWFAAGGTAALRCCVMQVTCTCARTKRPRARLRRRSQALGRLQCRTRGRRHLATGNTGRHQARMAAWRRSACRRKRCMASEGRPVGRRCTARRNDATRHLL